MSLKARQPLQDVGPEWCSAHRGALDPCCQSACRTARLHARWRNLSAPPSHTTPRSRNAFSRRAAAGPPATPPPHHAMKPIRIFRCGHPDCCKASALQHAAAILSKASDFIQLYLYDVLCRCFLNCTCLYAGARLLSWRCTEMRGYAVSGSQRLEALFCQSLIKISALLHANALDLYHLRACMRRCRPSPAARGRPTSGRLRPGRAARPRPAQQQPHRSRRPLGRPRPRPRLCPRRRPPRHRRQGSGAIRSSASSAAAASTRPQDC